MVSMIENEPLQRLLAATEKLIYANGINATGMEAIVNASGVARKTIYRHFPTKEDLIAEVLRQRDQRWMQWFIASTSAVPEPKARMLASFDALEEWFLTEDFNGCAFINAAGECGSTSTLINAVAKEHKVNLAHYLEQLAAAYGVDEPKKMAADLLLLIEGAITVAKVMGDKTAAKNGKRLAEQLLLQ